ncbi:Hpt domain-containing protein [Pseudodesulfovibrio tunisiensis]|uniref:Hpt domain-containing protein n=1 Tax=Pseudodesulfovibrio tunisiensis TaxID=463192 RepID=UPI001FB50D0D|nr:Hpt domain-containing protein [Pseudodesulfovibrio tunisiensis]
MAKQPMLEHVDAELEVLMDRFFASSRRDVETMRQALAEGDLATVTRLGHSAKGAGRGYGFLGMGELGRELEQAGKAGDRKAAEDALDRLAHYLDNVRYEFK